MTEDQRISFFNNGELANECPGDLGHREVALDRTEAEAAWQGMAVP